MIGRCFALAGIAAVSLAAVLGLRYRTHAQGPVAPNALASAHSTPGRRTVQTLGLRTAAGGFALHSARAARDGSRQLFYRNGRQVVSVFVSGHAIGDVVPTDGWRMVVLHPGRPAYAHTDPKSRTALAWRQGGRLCIATADTPSDALAGMVRALTD